MRLALATCLAGILLVVACSDEDSGGAKCKAPLVDCGEAACHDPAVDPRHCGGCGVACDEGEACLASACVALRCDEGQTACDHACVDLSADPAHCGGCVTACFEGQACDAGSCRCPEGTKACGEACVDPASDVFHCGECENECEGGDLCREGACVPAACDGRLLLPGLAELELGGPVRHAELVDWDGDGRLDLLAALVEPSQVRLFVNIGDGTFEPRGRLGSAPGGFFRVMEVDEKPALLVADPSTPGRLLQVSQVPGGLYTVPVLVDTTQSVEELLLAELDGEPGDELILATAGELRLYFDPELPVVLELDRPRNLRIAELGDGRRSLLAATSAGLRIVRISAGGDMVVEHAGPPSFPGQFEVADLDGDGRLDLVASSGLVLRNRGDGQLEPWDVPLPGGYGVTVADLNGDGRLDLVFAREGELRVRLGAAGGFASGRTIAGVPGVTWVKAARLDGDGAVDLLVVDTEGGHAVFHGGHGDGIFLARNRASTFVGSGPRLGIAQVWGSGAGELLVGFRDRPEVGVYRLSRWGMAEVASFDVGHGIEDLALGDVDGDGYADLLAIDRAADVVSVARSRPGSGFASPMRLPVGEGPTRLLLTDVDGDDWRDLLVLESEGQALRVIRNHAWTGESTLALPEVPHDLAAGDTNGDGAIDLLIAMQTKMLLLTGNGRGGFSPAFEQVFAARAVALGDLDGDGGAELVAVGSDTLTVLRHEQSSLQTIGSYEISGGVAVAVGDLDGDGRPDVLVLEEDGRVKLLRNTGGTTLEPAGRWGALGAALAPGEKAAMAVVDADRDGRREVIVAGEREQGWLVPGCAR